MDPWQFDQGKVITLEGTPLIGVGHPGRALDFSLTELATPVVSSRVVSVFESLDLQDEVQFIPARVQGQSQPYFILNTLRTLRCIDDARCGEVLSWRPEDERPDKLGKYRNVVGLKVDPAKVGGASIFRPWGWTVALIVSERFKLAMETEALLAPGSSKLEHLADPEPGGPNPSAWTSPRGRAQGTGAVPSK